MSGDRNLLFAIFALQMRLVPTDALISAMNGWISQKHRSLAEIMLDQGSIDTETFTMLCTAVEKHIALHGESGQPRVARPVTPAATPVATTARPAVVATTGALPAAALSVSAPTEAGAVPTPVPPAVVAATPSSSPPRQPVTPPSPTAPPPVSRDPAITVASAEEPVTVTRGRSRYRILRPHAKGGLGEVSVALDEELRREVALKAILSRYAHHEDSRQRFMQEAEITGRLEHPCIVPVYGMGVYEDGRPYYAMRFIQGTTLADEIDRHRNLTSRDRASASLELHRLLHRFVDACNAIEYAHSRGILHRDIKPENIMLGRYGETMVVDWGLAKPIGSVDLVPSTREATIGPIQTDSGTARTEMGAAIGTPQYMSPEQAEGRHDRIGAASDVYSLGATLYALLTGQPPFEAGDTATVLSRVRSGVFAHPCRVRPGLSTSLASICVKAMALNPEDRYRSPRHLAEDLERWIADAPVLAHRERLGERISRWSRRHRSLATGGAVSLIAIAVISTCALVKVHQARRQEIAALEKAQTRFQLARDATDTVIQGITDLRDIPGTRKVYRKLMEWAAETYGRFAEDSGGDSDVQYRAAMARNMLGRIRWISGDTKRALADYQAADEALTRLLRERPGNLTYLTGRASNRKNIGDLHGDLPDVPAVLHKRAAAYRDALTDFVQVAGQRQTDQVNQDGLAATLVGLGVTLRQQQDPEAQKVFLSAIRSYEGLVALSPREIGYREGRARALTELGTLHEMRGDHAKARICLEEAIADLRLAQQERPELLRFRWRFSSTLRGLARIALRQRRYDDVRKLCAEGIQNDEQLIKSDPQGWRHRRSLAMHHWTLAGLSAELNRPDEEERALRASISEFSAALGQTQSSPALHEFMAITLTGLATVAGQRGHAVEAEQHLRKAIEQCQLLLKAQPDDRSVQEALSVCHGSWALLLAARGDHAQALVHFDEALRLGVQPSGKDGWQLWRDLPALRSPSRSSLLVNRCRTLVALRRPTAPILEEMDRVLAGSPPEPELLFDAACLAAAIWRAAPPGPQAQRCAGRVVELLERAAKAGFSSWARLASHPDLASFRSIPAVQKMIDGLKPRGR